MLKNSVTICPIFERIFPVLNKQFASLKYLEFGHYSFHFVSFNTEQFMLDQILQLPSLYRRNKVEQLISEEMTSHAMNEMSPDRSSSSSPLSPGHNIQKGFHLSQGKSIFFETLPFRQAAATTGAYTVKLFVLLSVPWCTFIGKQLE